MCVQKKFVIWANWLRVNFLLLTKNADLRRKVTVGQSLSGKFFEVIDYLTVQ